MSDSATSSVRSRRKHLRDPGSSQPDGEPIGEMFSLVRWLSALRPREVLVFVSSPGDCAAERALARRIVNELNDRPEVARQGTRFRPLLWEDLPPGIAEDGDFQQRINAVMRRFGYDAFGVYLGFMKARLGTRTPRHRSGTIEELEASLKGRRRSGTPSEVFFYFLAPDADDVREVREFRDELGRRGFLTSSITSEEFASRLSQNLLEIAISWNSWTNSLKRTWRRFGLGIVVAVTLVAGSIAGTDLGSRWQIGMALDSGDLPGAAALWRDRSLLMPVSGAGARQRINEMAAERIGTEASFERQLGLLAEWRLNHAYLPSVFVSLKKELGTRAERTIEVGVIESPDPRGVELWRAARLAGVWTDNVNVPVEMVRLLAGGRLLHALAATEIPPERWEGALLRPTEAKELIALAQRILRQTPNLAGWKSRKLRAAISVLAGDQPTLAKLATETVQTVDSFEQPEAAAFIATATSEAIAAWLRQTADPNLPLHVVGRIIEAVHARRDPAAILTIADLIALGQLTDGADQLLESVQCPLPECAALATERLTAWVDDAPLSANALDMLLAALDPDRLSVEQRELLSRAIVARAKMDDRSSEMIRALSILGVPTGLRFLDDLLDQHKRGSISFGFAEREALIDQLLLRDEVPDRLGIARAIMVRSENDADVLGGNRNAPFRTLSLVRVERAYLDLLAEVATAVTLDDRELFGRIVERMMQYEGADSESRKLMAIGRVLLLVPSDWRESLFDFPRPPVVDPPWEAKWDRRRLLLEAIGKAGGPPPRGLAAAVLRSLPNDEALASEFARLAAAIDPGAGRDYFRDRLVAGDRSALLEMGRLDDAEALTAHVKEYAQNFRAVGNPLELKPMIDAVGALDVKRRAPVIAELISHIPSAASRLLPTAAPTGVDLPELRTAALDALRRPRSATTVASAVAYLARIAPAELWITMTTQPAIGGLIEWLANADAFDWTMVAQELEPPSGRLPDGAGRIAMARRLLVAIDEGAHLPNNAEAGWIVLDNQRRAANHLMALLARHGEPTLALQSLQALAEGTAAIDTLGALGEVETVFRAYTTWLAAVPVLTVPLDCLPPSWFGVGRLDDANPLVVRAASALILARPEAAVAATAAGLLRSTIDAMSAGTTFRSWRGVSWAKVFIDADFRDWRESLIAELNACPLLRARRMAGAKSTALM
jgi:hypothetical protein